MRFLLHGATNWGSSNFGDFLYAYEIFTYLKELDPENKVGFYDASDYFCKYIDNYEIDKVSLKDADYLVYLPGGYFGEGHKPRFRDNVIQFIRFMPFGLKGAFFKKKMLVVGVGAGPINSWMMKMSVKTVCKKSTAVSTRDNESRSALQKIGISDIPNYSDMMVAYDLKSIARKTEQTNDILSYAENKKILLVHYNHSKEAMEKFALAVSSFVSDHKEYKLVVAADSILPYEQEYFEQFSKLCNEESYHYIYDDPYELIELIRMSDAVLTCKLHVGVIACMFNKAVMCAAEHPEKTFRFYKQVDKTEQCISLYDSSADQIKELLTRYHKSVVSVPETETENAKKHWTILQNL